MMPVLRPLLVRKGNQEFSHMDFGQETGVNIFPLIERFLNHRCPELPIYILVVFLQQQRCVVVAE